MAMLTREKNTTRRERWGTGCFPILLLLALAALLAGCGPAMEGSQLTTSTSTPSSTTPTPTPAKLKGRTSIVCPAPQVPADAASFKPDVIITQTPQPPGATQSITLAQGQRLEMRLQPGYSWRLTITDQDHILAVTSQGGWYNADVHACIWHFTAAGKGEAQLSFQGALGCPPLEACPAVEQSATYRVIIR